MSSNVFQIFADRKLSDAETLSAQSLSRLTVLWLQQELIMACRERLSLSFDPSNQLVFLQREAELKGQIGVLTYLLECSERAVAGLVTPPAAFDSPT